MGVILGILSEGDAPCVETPDSPSIEIGEPECLLSTDTDNPPSSEKFQDIRSVCSVDVTRTFTCFKKDFQLVRNWLASLDGGALQYNAGLHGKAVIGGRFRLVGGIRMTDFSPTLATVEATWRGYVLDCNIDLADSIRFRKDSDTQWSIVCGDKVVLTATSDGPGDGTGLLIVPGECVTWKKLPKDVQPKAPQYDLVSSRFPTTPDECRAAINGGRYITGYTVTNYQKTEHGAKWTSVANTVTFPSEHFAYLSKWRAFRLLCNGQAVLTWWVQVSCLSNSIDPSMGIRVYPVYYGQTQPEVTSEKSAIRGPIDITDSSNGRLATNIAKVDAHVEYGGKAGPDAWAARPDVKFSRITAVTVQNKIPKSYDYVFIEPSGSAGAVNLDTLQIDGLVHHGPEGNTWAFEAFPGEKEKSIRFWTPPTVFVSSVYVSPAGQVTVRTYSVLYCYHGGTGEDDGSPQMIALEGGWKNPKIGKWWENTVTWKEYREMMQQAAAFSENIEVETEESSSPSESPSSSPSESASASRSSSAEQFTKAYVTPSGFMAYMEDRINDWLVANGYLASADDENAFHYDLDWTSRDTCQVVVGQDLPEDAGNPVFVDAAALNSETGYNPSESLVSSFPDEYRTINLAKRTTDTSPYAPFSSKGCFSCADTWTKTVDGQTSTVTYEDVFAAIIRDIDRAGYAAGREAARKPRNYSIYAARTSLHFPDSEVVPVPIARYGLIGFVCAPDAALEGENPTSEGTDESTVRLFWREDERYVSLLANNAYNRNALLTFDKKPEESDSDSGSGSASGS